MNNAMKGIALRMWGTTTPTVEQVGASHGEFDVRGTYDEVFGIYSWTHAIDQAWLSDRGFVDRMYRLNVHMRVVVVLSDEFMQENAVNDEAMVRFRGEFKDLVEWILWLNVYTTSF
jgi:hypothetical protein